MKFPLLAAFLIMHVVAFAQEPHLQLLKNGKVKKRLPEGKAIILTDHSGAKYIGSYSIINDSNVSIAGTIVPLKNVVEFRFPKKTKKPFDWKRFGYATAGFVLSAAGMFLSKWETAGSALASAAVLAYAQYPIQAAKKLIFSKKKKFRIGKKRKLRVWSLNPFHQQQKAF